MTGDRYRLAPVRTLREVGEQTSKGALADAARDASATAAALAAASARVAEIRGALAHTRALAAATPAEVVRAEQFRAKLRRDLDDAIATELRARAADAHSEVVVDRARARVIAARADKEVVERHFTRWRQTQRKTAERKGED